MNAIAQWHRNNEDYLAPALDWLKLRLQTQAGVVDQHQDALQEATLKMEAAANTDHPPALRLLGQLFDLSLFEQHVLLLCAAVELDTQIAQLCARAQDNPNRPYPTFALALSLFEDPTWDIVSPQQPLCYWRLIEVHTNSTQTLTASPLRADERIVNYLKGLNELDERLAPFVKPFSRDYQSVHLPPSQQASTLEAIAALQKASRSAPAVVQLVGSDSLSQHLVAQAVARELGLYLYRFATHLLPTQLSELETLERLCQRESRLLPILFYLDAHTLTSLETTSQAQNTALVRFLNYSHSVFLLGTREIQPGIGQTEWVVDIDKPTSSEQNALWLNTLKEAETQGLLQDRQQNAALLSSQFHLNAITIHQVAASVLVDRQDPDMSGSDRLWSACQTVTRPQLDTLAQRLDPKATWDDIVLPEDETTLLQQIANQVRQRHTVYEDWGFHQRMNRGLGISTLFAGESGTGKTMAAEVIANELRLDLYRIDLSAVVSKYIGETEKNLRRLFDAAENGGAILFFDEADALFGKRSEVKDSHDRYANIEINYLLQRIESYRGLAILATNFKNAIDSAFMRRLRFVVNFPFPGTRERQLIWQKAFPVETPQQNLNFKQLARFNLTGGNIHNIVLNAAFLAAQAKTAVTMPQVLAATRTEFRKLDRPINEADFQVLD